MMKLTSLMPNLKSVIRTIDEERELCFCLESQYNTD